LVDLAIGGEELELLIGLLEKIFEVCFLLFLFFDLRVEVSLDGVELIDERVAAVESLDDLIDLQQMREGRVIEGEAERQRETETNLFLSEFKLMLRLLQEIVWVALWELWQRIGSKGLEHISFLCTSLRGERREEGQRERGEERMSE
jgi:hypothetical protein